MWGAQAGAGGQVAPAGQAGAVVQRGTAGRFEAVARSEAAVEPVAGRRPGLAAVLAGEEDAGPDAAAVWPVVAEQFALRMMLLAEELRPALDRLENDEDDPERLERLYRVDHAVTRMRRAARELRVLAGREGEELDGHTSSLVDVIRVATSAIERYTQVVIGTVAELAVVAYAADDVAALLAALLDNATRYSRGAVTVSGHLLQDGAVMLRIEDTGIGIDAGRLAEINRRLAGPVPQIDDQAGIHTGFPVVHRLARRHDIAVRLACRAATAGGGSGGTTAMVTVPAGLLCEIPAEPAAPPAPEGGSAEPAEQGPSGHLTMVRQVEPAAPVTPGGLPRRERASLRGNGAAAGSGPAAPAAGDTTAEEAAAARRSFAADLDAFAAGHAEARRETGGHHEAP
ncbi:ATP-binding protein [Thermomonospora cellulosilytica]|uniref:histidine kinase n=1 Tax=Thermomonospora cellulosilytica TaxID=1411118 RepID=A0A7W3MXT7_9ACTN|nr:ATP-binding protein [Thermomonospora cellulosilytica]MBA9003903.1 hypothetical protein [Thermomonospora cellulosilytica]